MTNENKPTIELGKQYQTRDGREVKIYAVNAGGRYPVHGAIKNSDDIWSAAAWTLNGSSIDEGIAIDQDFIEIKPKRKIEFWVNVFDDREVTSVDGRDEANARLIASAPDLLAEVERLRANNAELVAALKRVLLDIDFMIEAKTIPDVRDDVIYGAARAAIARAEGGEG
jgi:hypothetical protein